jgi:hypothetical protein
MVDRLRAPHVATEVGDAVLDPYIDVAVKIRRIGIERRIDTVRNCPIASDLRRRSRRSRPSEQALL